MKACEQFYLKCYQIIENLYIFNAASPIFLVFEFRDFFVVLQQKIFNEI